MIDRQLTDKTLNHRHSKTRTLRDRRESDRFAVEQTGDRE